MRQKLSVIERHETGERSHQQCLLLISSVNLSCDFAVLQAPVFECFS